MGSVLRALRWNPIPVLAVASIITTGAANGATLTVLDGVVVKFGQDAGLATRDQIVIGKSVLFTSSKDDQAGGATLPTSQTAAASDWRGVRIEKTAQTAGVQIGDGTTIRYAGGAGGAALTLRGVNPAINYLQLTDSVVGLRLQLVASPSLSGTSILRNGTGMEADDGAAPVISGSQFVGNTGTAVVNNTPSIAIAATGNWWGDATGPRDSTSNPQGLGDAVSAGITDGQFLTQAPLLDPRIAMDVPAPYVDKSTVAVDITCLNAVAYRIAENGDFTGIGFQSLGAGTAIVNVPLSAGDGHKSLTVQFQNAAGATVSADLTPGILVDTQAPQLAIASPAAGSTVTGTTDITVTASDANGIDHVAFYLDGMLAATLIQAPYTYHWNTTGIADGNHTWRVVSVDTAGRSSEQSDSITLANSTDTVGPGTTNLVYNGSPLSNGATLNRSGTVTLSAADPSGVAKVELQLDGTLVATLSGTGGSYSGNLALDNVANGSHTLAVRATDTLGNVSTSTVNVMVAHPVVSLTSPAPNTLLAAPATITLSATASAAGSASISQVSFYNGATFIGSVSAPYTLAWPAVSAGTYQLTAQANDNAGGLASSNAVTVTVFNNMAPTVSVSATPTATLAPATITLSATAADSDGSVAKVEFYNNDTLLGSVTQAPYGYSWTNVPAGNYRLTAKATDNLGAVTQSAPVNVSVAGPLAQVYYVHNDQINAPRVVTDSNNNVVWQWDNADPFGNSVPNADPGNTGSRFTFNQRFPGQYFDNETGLFYNYFRDYDPATGRYIESDPLGLFGGSMSTYSYVDSNPLVFYDPTGLQIAVPVTPPPPAGGGSNGSVNGGVPGYNPVTDMPTSIPPSRPSYTPIPASVCFAAPAICAIIIAANKPPKDAHDPNGAKAPGQPGDAEGFCEPKKGPKWGKSPNGRGSGWVDNDGNVWVPTGWGSDAHGGPHWDVQRPDGSYENVYPGGKRR